jgi:Na+/H+-dicarboxylate symporter
MLALYKENQGSAMLLALFLACPLAFIFPELFTKFNWISTLFINLLKIVALPIIATSLITTFGALHQFKEIKTIASHTVAYILISEVMAVSIGLILFNQVDFSYHINPELLTHPTLSPPPLPDEKLDLPSLLNALFTSNIWESLVNLNVLSLILFSMLIGFLCSLKPNTAKPFLKFSTRIKNLFFNILNKVMLLAPPAIFILVGNAIVLSATSDILNNVIGLFKFVILFFTALLLHILWQIGLVLFLHRGLTFKTLIQTCIPIFYTAFITSSSLMTLPIAMEKAEKLGGNKKVVELMLPICASMNFSSGMMYEIAAALFFMHVLGIHPTFFEQIVLAFTCILTGIAVGGIPETSMISLVTIFNMAHIPLSAISILMPLDRFVDRIRTIINIFGNTCGTLTVSKMTD